MTRRLRTWISTTTAAAAWAPAGTFGLHLALAAGLDAYRAWPPLDVPMHALGGVAVAFLFATGLRLAVRQELLDPVPAPLELALVAGLTALAALGWEGLEWAADRLAGTQAQLSLADTLADQLVGVAGAVAWWLLDAAFRARAAAPVPPRAA
jgi:hypothetical protein